MKDKEEFTREDAKKIGDGLGVDWDEVSLDEFTVGINVELEHGTKGNWNITDDDLEDTAKIALAHLDELPDYYTRLGKMEEEGKKELDKEGDNNKEEEEKVEKDDEELGKDDEQDSDSVDKTYLESYRYHNSQSLAEKLTKAINRIS